MGLFGKKPPPPPPEPLDELLEFGRTHAVEIAVGTLAGLVILRFLSWFVGFVFYSLSDEAKLKKKIAEAEARRRRYRAQITQYTFRALKSIAMADGVFHAEERRGLIACAKALAVKCPDLDALEPITPEALAKSALGKEPEKCAHLLTLMCHFSLVDGEEHPDEFKMVERFAKAFEVEPKTLADLRARTMRVHDSCETALKKSRRPELARQSSAILLANQEFFAILNKLCHR